MNIYYSNRQGLDIRLFWSEIFKMSIAPIIVTSLSYWIVKHFLITSWLQLGISLVVFAALYIPLFWQMSMNAEERILFKQPFLRLLHR